MTTRKKSPAKHRADPTLDLAFAKLATSGLAPEDFATLRLDVTAQANRLYQYFKPLPALVIPYYDPFRPTERLRGWPGWPPFYRIRYLADDTSFAAQTEKKPRRYANPPDAGVCAYFPPGFVDWPTLLSDPTEPLIITEGELKAAKACREGYPTVGLGGVYNYRSSKLGLTFLAELEAITWVQRHVYLAFDSDFRTNEMVCAALNDLAEELMKRGAVPHLTPLPDVVDGGKTGLDDFLVARPAEELADLLHDRSTPLTLSRALWRLNDEVVYVRDPGFVLVRASGQQLSPAAFKDHAFATLNHAEQVVHKDGSLGLRPASAAARWLTWQLRAEVDGITYRPGKPRLIEARGRREWNRWRGWGVEPKAGDVTPFTQLLDHLFAGAEPAAREWFVRWCAFPLQYPGTKLFTTAVLWGRRHGTGKSLVGHTLGAIYGENFKEIGQAQLHSERNEWAIDKQFVLGDDVTGSDKRDDADRLKRMITQKTITVDPKYIPSYSIPDLINYLLTSNQPDLVFLEDDDRRNFIHEVMVGPLEEGFYVDYVLWLESGGAAAVFDYLLNVDLGDFNPGAPALMTAAKRRMIQDVKSDLGGWVSRLQQDPDAVLRAGQMAVPGDLFTNRQLLLLYDPDGRTRTTANGLGRELRRAGVPLFAGGQLVQTPDGRDRVYVVRHAERWVVDPDVAAAERHLRGEDEAKPARGRPRRKY